MSSILPILERSAGRHGRAHALFQKAGETVFQNARALDESAQTKIKLWHASHPGGRAGDGYARSARLLLLREAKEMLQRVIQLDAGPQRHAWAWYDVGRVCRWLREPAEATANAFTKARQLAPHDDKLRAMLDRQEDTGL